MYKLFGRFDPVAGARIETALAAAAKQLWHAEDAKRRATPAQRFADALGMLVTRKGTGKAQSTTLLVIADTHNGWTRNNKHGPSGHRTGTTGSCPTGSCRAVNQPLRR